jgi:hypothetical protein
MHPISTDMAPRLSNRPPRASRPASPLTNVVR